ncbi:mechanosensitive ion channel family protein [Glaciecola sp. 2405UD65-10]|uniref:mechanosensitive ion channel family protein n=1 Tax=Glaciecola sp. 2405UD65-10 TaxID=3397244 RepID=UPI003B5BEFC2
METLLEPLLNLAHNSPVWLVYIVLFVGVYFLLWSLKRMVFYGLNRLVIKTRFTFGELLLASSRRALSVLLLALTISVTAIVINDISDISKQVFDAIMLLSHILLVVATIIFIDKFSMLSIAQYKPNSPLLKTSGSLLQGSLRVLIFCIGILVVLSTAGVSITPVLASLGIGSLAVALALQPTLENFFSGIQIVADKPFRVGDYIELDSGEQGFVEKIGWRSTWIKMLPNNIVIMPNSLLAKSKVINYYYPEKQLSVPVEVGVHYDSDLERVEEVTLEVAREVLSAHKWGISDYETFVVFHTFDSFSINFTVMLRAEEYFNRFFIKSVFMKKLHERFKQEGIIIPYPITALNMTQEKAEQTEM